MDKIKHTGLISGLNDLKQLELATAAAQKMTGAATMTLDPNTFKHAEQSIADAREIYSRAIQESPDTDAAFFQQQLKLLHQCEHQIKEALQ
ncbi:DUF2564 family protein [Bacillus lacus]|uniref:DUF2564 family protein n=1 Tax=Metabacillus lacus TaxID=1983721 RepID=A0A7X2LYS1_9BACI|nr:DUF2564 family protein [Metabacillus lacus]MRX70924.1 DUF2564 family protein [Metabacillus lacus]